MSQTIQPPAVPSPRPRLARGWRSWFSWRSGRTLIGIAVVIAIAIGVAILLTQCVGGSGQSGASRFRGRVDHRRHRQGGHRRRADHRRGAGHRHAGGHRLGDLAGHRPDQRGELHRGPGGGEGPGAGDDRPGPVPGRARPGQGHAGQGRGGAGRRPGSTSHRYHTLLAQNSVAKQTYDDQVATWCARTSARWPPTRPRWRPPRSTSTGPGSSRRWLAASACARSTPATRSPPTPRRRSPSSPRSTRST